MSTAKEVHIQRYCVEFEDGVCSVSATSEQDAVAEATEQFQRVASFAVENGDVDSVHSFMLRLGKVIKVELCQ